MNKCGFTVTGTRMRYECFLRQLQAYSLMIHNTLHILFGTGDNEGGDDARMRETIHGRIQDSLTFLSFAAELTRKCPDINDVIYATITPYTHLMGMDQTSRRPPDYMQPLWMFCTRLIYERPVIVGGDTGDGTHVMYIKDALSNFISEQVVLRPGKT